MNIFWTMQSYVEGFEQMIDGYTRFDLKGSQSLIDHIWTNTQQRIVSYENISSGNSDHNIISVTVRSKGSLPVPAYAMSRSIE